MTPRFTPHSERHGPQPDYASLSDLQRELGRAVERLPIEALPSNRPTFGCEFDSIPPCPYVDMSAIERLEIIAEEARQEMGEERWNQLQSEWKGTDDGH